MPGGKKANVKNEKHYEKLKEKGMSAGLRGGKAAATKS